MVRKPVAAPAPAPLDPALLKTPEGLKTLFAQGAVTLDDLVTRLSALAKSESKSAKGFGALNVKVSRPKPPSPNAKGELVGGTIGGSLLVSGGPSRTSAMRPLQLKAECALALALDLEGIAKALVVAVRDEVEGATLATKSKRTGKGESYDVSTLGDLEILSPDTFVDHLRTALTKYDVLPVSYVWPTV